VYDVNGFPVVEAYAGAKYLLSSSSIKRDHLFTEIISRDTIGNIYFSKVLLLDPLALDHVVIITSAFHMPRVKAISKWIFGMSDQPGRLNVSFLESPDPEYSQDIRSALELREAMSLKKIEKLSKTITSITDFTAWIQREHAAYSFDKESPLIDDTLGKAY
jgi:uncharacterized SAM-binding protein YcdF (DUF218 family)